MNLEIERKFLVKGEFKHLAERFEVIKQGYLSTEQERSVRVRLKGTKAFLTIKGKSNKSGTTRFEFEKEISVEEAEQLFTLSINNSIKKTRYYFPAGKHIYEVDVFEGQNNGLILAEIELNDEQESFIKPQWLGEEVTGNKRYYNLYLSNRPYTTWEDEPKIINSIAAITKKMIDYFGKDVRRINHALKVFAYAKNIAELEGISKEKQEIVKISAILHDIGIQVCEQKYNSTAGHYQEIESPIIAKELLKNFDISEKTLNRILYIIANHHSYSNIDNTDFQILVEADFLVNFEEGNESKSIIPKVKKNIFKTKTGLELLKSIF